MEQTGASRGPWNPGEQARGRVGRMHDKRATKNQASQSILFPPHPQSHTAARVQTDAVISILIHFRGPCPNCFGNQKSRIYLHLSLQSHILFQFLGRPRKSICACRCFCECMQQQCICICNYVYIHVMCHGVCTHLYLQEYTSCDLFVCTHVHAHTHTYTHTLYVQAHFTYGFCKCSFIQGHSPGGRELAPHWLNTGQH